MPSKGKSVESISSSSPGSVVDVDGTIGLTYDSVIREYNKKHLTHFTRADLHQLEPMMLGTRRIAWEEYRELYGHAWKRWKDLEPAADSGLLWELKRKTGLVIASTRIPEFVPPLQEWLDYYYHGLVEKPFIRRGFGAKLSRGKYFLDENPVFADILQGRVPRAERRYTAQAKEKVLKLIRMPWNPSIEPSEKVEVVRTVDDGIMSIIRTVA